MDRWNSLARFILVNHGWARVALHLPGSQGCSVLNGAQIFGGQP